MKIAVVDDFQKDRDQLALDVEEYLKEQSLPGEVYGYPGGEELLEALDRGEGYDTVFLDIYMNGMDGMSAARQLRQRGSACRIVFVTSSDSFAVEGYKVQAFRYLVKPYDRGELYEILDGLLEEKRRARPYLEIREDRISKKVYFDEIEMAEQEGHYTLLYLTNGENMRARMTVRELAQKPKEPRFLECYRNLLVNLDCVERVEEGKSGWEAFCMRGGRQALIQRSRRGQVKQYFTDYMFKKAEE